MIWMRFRWAAPAKAGSCSPPSQEWVITREGQAGITGVGKQVLAAEVRIEPLSGKAPIEIVNRQGTGFRPEMGL